MILYPEVQARAQEEIDRVVGRHRLPSFEDREALPYISAICCEIVRWHSPAPLSQYFFSYEYFVSSLTPSSWTGYIQA